MISVAVEWDERNLGSLATKSQMLPDQVKKEATSVPGYPVMGYPHRVSSNMAGKPKENHGKMVVLWDLYGIYLLVSSNMAEENPRTKYGGFVMGPSPLSMVHFPASHVSFNDVLAMAHKED